MEDRRLLKDLRIEGVMADLRVAFDLAMEFEGGGRTHTVPGDPGGTTKWGLSQGANPDLNIPALSREDAIRIYHDRYWGPRRLGELQSQTMANEIFEFTINADPPGISGGVAILTAQESANTVLEVLGQDLRLRVDGWMGPNTLRALNLISRYGPVAVMAWEGAPASFNIQQLDYYRGLRRDLVDRFLLGWTQRVVE